MSIAQLVGQVCEVAPAADKGRLLEQLLRPLGVLSLVAVADRVFAKIRFRGGWPELKVRLEVAQNVQTSDVIALRAVLLTHRARHRRAGDDAPRP